MEMDPLIFMCAFLRYKGGRRLKNQTFVKQNKSDHRRKLRIVLRRLTADRLTAAQQRVIERTIGHQRQHYLRVYADAHLFRRAVSRRPALLVKMLFGGMDDPPAAALVRRNGSSGIENMIYIYLPNKKEEE